MARFRKSKKFLKRGFKKRFRRRSNFKKKASYRVSRGGIRL